MSDENQAPAVEIPRQALSEKALLGVIEAFILREGTDYGAIEVSHEAKVQQIERQIESGRTKIIFDFDSQSVTLMSDLDWKKYQSTGKLRSLDQ